MAPGRPHVSPPYALVNADMHAPTFRDAAFDVITVFNALHHSSQLPALVAKLARILRPGGVLGMVEPYVVPLRTSSSSISSTKPAPGFKEQGACTSTARLIVT